MSLKLIAEFGANTKGLEKGLKDVESKLANLEKANKKQGDAAAKAAAKNAQSVKALKQFAVVAGATALAVGVKAVKAFAKFEKGMAEVGTLTKFTSKEMRAMSQETLKLTAKFGQTTDVMTKARYDIVSAGFKDITQQTMLLNQANELAIAGVTDVSTATDALTTVLNAYGEGAEGAQRASDLLFATVQAGKTTMPELAASIGKVLPTAAAAGVEFNEVSAALATMTAQGIQTPQAVTALNSALFALSAPTSEAGKAMAELGINTTNAEGAMLPLVDVFAQFEGMSLEQIREVVPDKEAAKAILAAANNMDIFRQNTEGMVNVAGVTREAYEKMASTTAQKLAVLNSSFEVLKTTFGAFITDNRSGIDVIGATTGVLNEWTGLLTLNEKGVSRIRTEWGMFVDELSDNERVKVHMDQIRDLAKREADLAQTVTKLNDEQLEAFVRNRTAANDAIVTDDQKTARRIQEINEKIAAERIAAFKETGTQISSGFSKILDSFKRDAASAAPEAAEPMSAAYSAEGQAVAAGFESVLGLMQGASAGAAGGIAAPLTGAMASAASTGQSLWNNMVSNLKTQIAMQVTVRTVQANAEGGLIYGFAKGGIAPSDTVPAMLTPGEFVVNRSQTQKNFGLLSAINSGTGGFADGGVVGFANGGGVSGTLGGGRAALGEADTMGAFGGGFGAVFAANTQLAEEALEAQAEINQQFLDMMDEFQQDMTDLQLEKMDEREQLFFERQESLSNIMQMPFSDEQKELMLERAAAFYDAQLALIEEKEAGEIAEREAEILEERLAKIQKFQQSAGKAFGQFFASQISGQKSFNQASEALTKDFLNQAVDAIVRRYTGELAVTQAAEIGKALIESPGTFGASLAKIPLILGAAGAAKAAIGGIKFHEGGIVGGSIDAPPADVPIIAQAGERVLNREETQALEAGPGGPIQIENIIVLDSDEMARFVVDVDPRSGNI
jgi:TP901 family phage tail tape measure protein